MFSSSANMNFVTVLRDFQNLGCEDQSKCALACRVYLDLKEDNRVLNLEKNFDAEFDLIFLCGDREGTSGCSVVFVPVLNTQNLDLLQLDQIQAKMAQKGFNSVTLAICDTSSTILYYQITAGFVEKS